MKKLFLVLSVGLLFLSGCVQHESIVETNPIGKVYEDSITIRNMKLPLPEGKWAVVGRGSAYSNNYEEIVLNKIVDNRIHAAVFIVRDSPTNSYTGYNPSKNLNREDILHVAAEKDSGRGQDGWYINHIRLGFSGSLSKANKESLQYIKDHKLTVPGNFIEVGHILTGKYVGKKYLKYSLYLNPEIEGLKPAQSPEWGSSDWNILKINNYPEKVAYVENLKEDGGVFHNKLKKAFGD
ncbi:MAG: hypothetical protein MI892_18805 [Desulfobacterales bacterium]|nr:hypothetical protein [Desulfobacterales bacterium]